MNGRLAKKIRKKVYGPNGATRERKYLMNSKTGQIIADKKRQLYQLAKKMLRRSEYGRA